MKKQIARQLVLHKETVRTLTENELDKVPGGIPPSNISCWCDPN